MPLVLDASVTLCWALQDETDQTASLALDRLVDDQAHVPSAWWFEVRNGLIMNERRRRLTEAQSARFLRTLSLIDVTTDRVPEQEAVLALARAYRLTVYDASYLELAQRLGLPLATLDKPLRKAARAVGTEIVGVS